HAARLPAAAAVLLAVAALGLGLFAHQARGLPQAARRAESPAPAARLPEPPAPAAAPAGQPGPEDQDLTVTGRVLDSAGKPLAGAPVALAGVWRPRRLGDEPRYEILARGQADGEGRFRLTGPRASPDRFDSLSVLAAAPLTLPSPPGGGE